jgi:hypothetical protein
MASRILYSNAPDAKTASVPGIANALPCSARVHMHVQIQPPGSKTKPVTFGVIENFARYAQLATLVLQSATIWNQKSQLAFCTISTEFRGNRRAVESNTHIDRCEDTCFYLLLKRHSVKEA